MKKGRFFDFLRQYDTKLFGISLLSVIKIVFIVWISVGVLWIMLYAISAMLKVFYTE